MRYRFEDFELDEAARVLRRAGREVPVQPKVMDLLLFLVRHRGRMVAKDVLFRELWPEAIVTEASLTRLVKEVRRVLGEDGRRQGRVRTLRGRGYRFDGDIFVVGGDPKGGREVPEGFVYSSDENSLWLTVERLAELIESWKDGRG